MPEQPAIRDAVREQIMAEPGYYAVAQDAFDRVESGRLTLDGDISYKSIFLQTYHRPEREIAGFIIGRFHAWLARGEASAVRIHVASTPQRDREEEANRAALSNLPPPFEASMRFGKADCDGYLTWPEDDPATPFPGSHLSSLPLEVGYSDPETLWWHFQQCGGVARWPYDCEWIIAIGKRDPRKRYVGDVDPHPD